MSKKNRNKKPKPTISADAWSFLAQTADSENWQRLLDLKNISVEAVLAFAQSRMALETYKHFEELSMSPEALQYRRMQEAAKRKADEIESLTIHAGLVPKLNLQKELTVGGPRWRPLGQLEAERERKELEEKARGNELFIIPEAEF
jgi:hypothetical protein